MDDKAWVEPPSSPYWVILLSSLRTWLEAMGARSVLSVVASRCVEGRRLMWYFTVFSSNRDSERGVSEQSEERVSLLELTLSASSWEFICWLEMCMCARTNIVTKVRDEMFE